MSSHTLLSLSQVIFKLLILNPLNMSSYVTYSIPRIVLVKLVTSTSMWQREHWKAMIH